MILSFDIQEKIKHKKIVYLKNIEVSDIQNSDVVDDTLKITIPSKIEETYITDIGISEENLIKIKNPSGIKILMIELFIEDGPVRINSLCCGPSVLCFPHIPSTVKIISAKACKELSFFDIDFSKATELLLFDNEAFLNCSFFKNLVFPPKLISIGKLCFWSSVFKNGLTFNNKLENIGQSAFSGAKINNTVLKIPDSVRTINELAFVSSSQFESLEIGSNSALLNIGELAFKLSSVKTVCIQAPHVNLNTAIQLFSECSHLKTVDLSEIKTETTIPCDFCLDCFSLKSIKFPPNTICINAYAFKSNSLHLKEIKLPKSIKIIKASAFEGNKISKVNFEDLNCLSSIETNAFRFNELETIPENILQIEFLGDSCFCENNIKQLTLLAPSKKTILGKDIFSGNKKLLSVSLKNTTENFWKLIPRAFFSNCSSLTKIEMPDTVKTLQRECFQNTGFTEFSSNSIETIEQAAFSYCMKLNKVNITTSSLKKIDAWTFKDSKKMEEIQLPTFSSSSLYLSVPDYIKEKIQKQNPFYKIL